jgi:hypothetical protein
MAIIKAHVENRKQFYLPSTKELPLAQQAYIIVDVAPMLTGDILNPDLTDGDNVNMRMAKLFLARIKEWNLTLEDGTALPVSLESMALLQREDFVYLISQPFVAADQALDDGQKKS